MRTFTQEEKFKTRKWVQSHKNEKWGRFYKVHYIRFDTEYSEGEYINRTEAVKRMNEID